MIITLQDTETREISAKIDELHEERGDGVLSLERPSTDDGFAVISVPGQSPQTISVPARTLEECLSEELGRLYPDEIYSEVVSQGLDLVKPRQ